MSAVLESSGVEIELDVAVARSADAGLWDTAVWDGAVWAQAASLGDWVDVTAQSSTITMAAGASEEDGVVTRWEAATFSFDLHGADWDPYSGPYAGILGTGTGVRFRWRPASSRARELPALRALTPDADGFYAGFLGSVDDSGWNYDPITQVVQVAATDQTAILAAWDGLEQSPIGQGESAQARVARILTAAEWPATERDLGTHAGVPVRDTTLAAGAWDMLLTVADTDLALLWLNRAGLLAYRSQARFGFGDVLTCNLVPSPTGDPADVAVVTFDARAVRVTRNIVNISRQGQDGETPATVGVRDEGSIVRYRPHTYERTDLIHVADAWSTTVANAVLAGSAWPSAAPGAAELDVRFDPGAAVLLLGLEPNQIFNVTDGVSSWRMAAAGWSVSLTYDALAGTLALADVTTWLGTGSPWDDALWDTDVWG